MHSSKESIGKFLNFILFQKLTSCYDPFIFFFMVFFFCIDVDR